MRLILIIAGVYLTVLCGCGSCNSNNYIQLLKNHPEVISHAVPKYYDTLFKPIIKNRLRLVESREKKYKDTLSNFLYDEKYYVQLYKLSNSYNYSLKKSLQENYKENHQQVGVYFDSNFKSSITILDKMDVSKTDIPSKIFISFYGNNPRTIAKNDSVADYYIALKNLSIQYNAVDGPQEYYVEPKPSISDTFPLELLFIKRNKMLFLAFISPKKGDHLPSEPVSALIFK